MNLKCKVCNGELTKWRKKKCVECDPFWDKASDIINDKDRVEVIFDTANKENNLVGFAKAIKVDWDSKAPNYLCKYTSLPMIKKLPEVKRKVDEDDDQFKKRQEDRDFLKLLVFSPDRKENAKKYEPGNIEVCSYIGNVMKNVLSEDTFDSVIKGIIMSKLTIGRDKELAKMLIMTLIDFYSEEKRFDQSELDEIFEKRTLTESDYNPAYNQIQTLLQKTLEEVKRVEPES